MKNFLVIFSLVMFCTFSSRAQAEDRCDCEDRPSLKEAYDQSSLVFTGRAESLQKSPFRPNKTEVTFLVFERFKNNFDESKEGKVVIYTPDSMDNCGFNFVMEQDYLVFATGNPAAYNVSLCSPTEIVEAARGRLESIKKFK